MDYKAIVIGSGPGGYTAAIKIAQLGGKVAIVERDLVGGICTNWGCTPSKAMITSAKYAKFASEAESYGVLNNGFKIDFERVVQRRDEIVSNSRNHIRSLLDHWRVDILHGEGEVISNNTVRVKFNQDNSEKTFETENIILATGSTPHTPDFVNSDENDNSIVSSNRLVSIKELPEELTIIGGGIIGLEFSALFSHFGTKVRIIEYMNRCLTGMCGEISEEIQKQLVSQGIEILTSHKVLSVKEGKITVEEITTGATKILDSQMTLVATGRDPVFNTQSLDHVGIKYSKKGIETDSKMKTNFENIYAIGDATGHSVLAHVAMRQGIIAAENIMGQTSEMNYDVIPAVVYTLPEVASVGVIPEDMSGVKEVKFPFSANLRATIEGHDIGFVKLWVNTQTQTLLAAQIIGDYAGEIIQAYADIIALKLNISNVTNIIHAHPTYNEIVKNSLEFALGRVIEYV
jgi:dihydrolipoamide dehydrogenase